MPSSGTSRLNCLSDLVAGKEPLPFGSLSSKWHLPLSANNPSDMTAVFRSPQARSPLHVLIIAVGKFEGGQFTDLPGICESAGRAAQFWQDRAMRFPSRQLGSVDLLMSPCGSPPDIEGINGEPIERATLENVRIAFGRWADLCSKDPGSGAILHWIGHGAHEFGSGDGPSNRLLFCEDYDAGVERQNAVELSRIVQALRCMPFSDRGLLLIDTCRSEADDDSLADYQFPFPNEPRFETDGPAVNEIACLGLRYPGDRTRSYPNPRLDCGFKGGALFTEAVLDAIQTFGAERVASGEPWFSKGNTLPAAVNARLELWRDHLSFRAPLAVALSADCPWPIAEVTQPAAMIRVEVQESDAGRCPVGDINLDHVDIGDFPTPDQAYLPASLKRRDERKTWRGDVPAGWWKPAIEGDSAKRDFKSLPPARDEHWII